MLTILHGDNIAASRNTFITLKQSSKNPVSLRGGFFTITDLVQIFEGGELFAQNKDVFIEDLFGKTKKGQELEIYTDYLTRHAVENTIVLWEGKIMTKTQLGFLKNSSVQIFKLPTFLFSLLDGLRPNNTSFLIIQAQKVMNDIGEEILFSMLIRHIRMLLALREKASTEEVKKLAPWQRTKLTQQASSFTTEHLITLHKMLFLIDTTRKIGTNTLPLPASIDFFLLRI